MYMRGWQAPEERRDIYIQAGPSLSLSGRFCISSLPPVEVSVSLTHLQTAEQELGNSCAVAPAVAPVPGLASQVPPATGHGAGLRERNLDSLGLSNKRTGVRVVPLGGAIAEIISGLLLPLGRSPSQGRPFHSILLLPIL